MTDKKMVAIFALLVLLVITGVGWFSARSNPVQENIHNWTQIFHGYETYLDRRISYSVVSGTSMEPTFREGDAVLWVGVDNTAELKVGDIIIYKHPTRPYLDNIAHRIIEVGTGYRENQFETKGDNSSEEYWVPSANIHGLVIGVIYSTTSFGQP